MATAIMQGHGSPSTTSKYGWDYPMLHPSLSTKYQPYQFRVMSSHKFHVRNEKEYTLTGYYIKIKVNTEIGNLAQCATFHKALMHWNTIGNTLSDT